jgi:hypothetical protein
VDLDRLSVMSIPVRSLAPADSARRRFTAETQDEILALGGDLHEVRRWTSPSWRNGHHTAAVDGEAVLMSLRDSICRVDTTGAVTWAYEHRPWATYEGGCAWFDERGVALAVVPSNGDGCVIRSFDPATGEPQAASSPLEAWPAGIEPIPQGDNWTGLAVAEGQDGCRTWWTRVRTANDIEVVVGPTDDVILTDVSPDGSEVLFAPFDGFGELTVMSFPELDELRCIESPDDESGWGFDAAFVNGAIVARLVGDDDRVVVIHGGEFIDVPGEIRGFSRGADNTLLTAEAGGISSWRLVVSG